MVMLQFQSDFELDKNLYVSSGLARGAEVDQCGGYVRRAGSDLLNWPAALPVVLSLPPI